MKSVSLKIILCLAALTLALACARNSANSTSTHSDRKASAPRTAAEEAQHGKDENLKRLEASLPKFTKAPSAARLTGHPYFNGKAVALSKYPEDKDYGLDNTLILTTRSNVIADAPEEIRTIVLVTYRKQQVGTYTTTSSGKIPAFLLVADLVIIDRSLGAVIFRKTFKGDPPESNLTVTRGATQVVGADPAEKVRAFLEQLPRK